MVLPCTVHSVVSQAPDLCEEDREAEEKPRPWLLHCPGLDIRAGPGSHNNDKTASSCYSVHADVSGRRDSTREATVTAVLRFFQQAAEASSLIFLSTLIQLNQMLEKGKYQSII